VAILRTVVVLDAADLDSVSDFWAGVFDGKAVKEASWHSVIDSAGEWRMGIQLNPTHVRPEWPNGLQQQQVHLDLHVDNFQEMHQKVMLLGATVLQESQTTQAPEGFQVYADPAGHPFCLGWGQPTNEQLAAFLKRISL
jgi:predicted enzyme related to lactoylglutathione lyase